MPLQTLLSSLVQYLERPLKFACRDQAPGSATRPRLALRECTFAGKKYPLSLT